jgi:cellobiose-specific phosphotransferase system component IIB
VLFRGHVHQPAGENDCRSRTAGPAGEINAYGVAEFAEQVGHYQVVLLGPQVKYMQQICKNRRINTVSASNPST